ncbi:MAG TPA: DUF4157 domain-containing protein [Gammaproteobacteria bacterium]
MPDQLKGGLERLSGFDLSPVRVHYNSPKPAQMGALAYAQGTEIHLGRGQERHLPHEGWHVVQQMQGRVRPTAQYKSVALNDDETLENEADVMGARALAQRLDRCVQTTGAVASGDAQIVQRVALGISDDRDTELNTDNLQEIAEYVIAKLQAGRRDLVNILIMRVAGRAPEHLQAVRQIIQQNEDTFQLPQMQQVPENIHMIWMGDRITEAAYNNIVAMHERIAEGWRLTLWTDSRRRQYLATPLGRQLQGLARENETFSIADVDELIDQRIAVTYARALERNAYSMASDLARYSILHRHGGVYMDVDLSPGNVNMDNWNMQMTLHGLPALGPNIRDVRARDENLSIGLGTLALRGELQSSQETSDNLAEAVNQSFDAVFGGNVGNVVNVPPETLQQAVTMESAIKTAAAAQVQYMLGNFSNQFIAAPAGHTFINHLINMLSRDLEGRDDWDPQQVAALTGPSKFSRVISSYYGEQGISNIENSERRYMIDPHWLQQIAPMHWLTAESENQLGREQQRRGGISRTTAVLAVMAIIAITLIILNIT